MQLLIGCFIGRNCFPEANGNAVQPQPVGLPWKHLEASLNGRRRHRDPGLADQYFKPVLKRLYASVDRSFTLWKHAWNQPAFDALDGEPQTRSRVTVRIDRKNFQTPPQGRKPALAEISRIAEKECVARNTVWQAPCEK